MSTISSQTLLVFGWGLTGLLMGVVGIFASSGSALSRSHRVDVTPGSIPTLDSNKPGKYETATFGMG